MSTPKPSLPADYVVPQVWEPKTIDGVFSGMNRPTAGARTQKELPRGKHPLQLYSLGTPNGIKVTILLEELGVEYDAWYINIMQGDQFTSGFVDVNPNSKIPALLDYVDEKPIRVFESVSILIYLAEKYQKFIPTNPRLKVEMMNWLIWQVGTAPYLGGGFGHFYRYAPVNIEYAIDRFSMETKRILDVLDKQLEGKDYVVGEYTIADMAIYPWVYCVKSGYNAYEFLKMHEYKNIERWMKLLEERDAVKRGMKVNRNEEGSLKERHSADDFNKL
jgi:GST-like protein